jgi:hypothetical protein
VGLIIEVPSDFVILAQSPNGIQLEVHCVHGEINHAPELFQQDSYIMYQGESEEFVNFTPPAISITINSGGKSVSQDFTPQYDLLYPNGPDCEPERLVGSIVISMRPPLAFEPSTYLDESAVFELTIPDFTIVSVFANVQGTALSGTIF